MKALSAAQANSCENAVHPNCRCRCRGAFHGAKRVGLQTVAGQQGFPDLPDDDPHKLSHKQVEDAQRKLGFMNDGTDQSPDTTNTDTPLSQSQ